MLPDDSIYPEEVPHDRRYKFYADGGDPADTEEITLLYDDTDPVYDEQMYDEEQEYYEAREYFEDDDSQERRVLAHLQMGRLTSRISSLQYTAPGYYFERAYVELPQLPVAPVWGQDLQTRVREALPNVETDTVGARREFLVAPVLLELALYLRVSPRRDYTNPRLPVRFDYLLQGGSGTLAIHASTGSLAHSFVQLCARMATTEAWRELKSDVLYGAATVGNVWQFCLLHRKEKRIVQDLHLYRVPEDLPGLLRILVGILAGPGEAAPVAANG